MPENEAPLGRPSRFTLEIAEQICSLLAEGKTLRAICRDETLPHESTVRKWANEDRDGFYTQYVRARDLGLDSMADEMLDISDDGQNDWMEIQDKDGKNVGWRINGEAVNRSKLRVDARKWYLAKLAPKRYGEKLVTDDATSEDRLHELRELQLKGPARRPTPSE